MLLNEQFPWLCNTVKTSDSPCSKVSGQSVSTNEVTLADGVSIQGLTLYGLKMIYYKVEHGPDREKYSGYDRIYGEDELELISRSFYFKGYLEQIPPNVKQYQIQGIWGEDVVTIYLARGAFSYYSTYGGEDKNAPETYDAMTTPYIGDIIYLPNNETFYEILDVKEYSDAFGLASHTWTITARVWKDTKLTIDNTNPTLPSTDPIYNVTTSAYPAQTQTDDIFKLNDKLTDDFLENNGNVNFFDWTVK